MAYQCSKCSYAAKWKNSVKLHEKTVHSDIKPLACPFGGCNFKTKTKTCLKDHQRVHETQLELRKPYYCKIANCEYRAGRQTNLRQHVRARHTPKSRNFQCTLCSSKFYCKESLISRHIGRHVKERRFRCRYCEFITHSGIMLSHVKFVQKNLVNFNCSFPGCSYSSTYRLAVRWHFSLVHSSHPDPAVRRPCACSFPGCGYRTINPVTVKKHISVNHNPERSREYACPLCPKKFFAEKDLRGHVNSVHTNEKGYKCSKCHYA